MFCVFSSHRMNVNGVLQPPGFFGELTGQRVSCLFVDPVENVKVDLSHVGCQGSTPARDSRNSDNSDTGRPVAPF